MNKHAPSRGRIAAMVVFALSCFGILLFLWSSFGGPVPLRPQGYRFEADFTEANQLTTGADVRISGVSVGRVVGTRLAANRVTRATIEIDSAYAPVPRDTRVILRQKTLLGETYLELTPGDRRGPSLPDGARLAGGQVRPTVELDEILRALDPSTRRDLKRFVVGLAGAVDGRGQDISDVLGQAAPFAQDSGDVLRELDLQSSAVRRLVRDTGVVFGALGRRQGELSGLVRAADTVLATTARRDRELRATVAILPTTLRELRPTFGQIESVSRAAAPLVAGLRPSGRALGSALADARALAPQLQGAFRDIDRVTALSRRGLPAATATVLAAQPVFGRLAIALRELLPVVDYAGLMKQEVVTQLANIAAATQGSELAGGTRRHYLRALVPFTAEGLVAAPQRAASNRANPYLAPRGLDKLAAGLESFNCANRGAVAIQPAPPCRQQAPFYAGRAFPQLRRR